MAKSDITGIVLCGGKSSRMGQDKGLLSLGNQTLLEISIKLLQKICGQILVSTNHPDKINSSVKTVNDLFPGIGPISGIYSAMLESTTDHNLVISCDTPFLTPEVLEFIVKQSKGYEIALPEFNSTIQSLTGYFNRNILQFIEHEIRLKHYKPIQMFQQRNLKIIPIHEKSKYYKNYLFFNINTTEDYQEATRIHAIISK